MTKIVKDCVKFDIDKFCVSIYNGIKNITILEKYNEKRS